MKSTFAKFVDSSVGAVLVFLAATAVMRYYTTLELAMISAASITACVCLLLKLSGRKKRECAALSEAAERMFYDFMFMSDVTPAQLLQQGLCSRGVSAVRHGKSVYVGKTSAHFFFAAPPDAEAIAKTLAKCRRYGSDKAILLCRTAPTATLEPDGFTVKPVVGDAVYKLFGSLSVLPEHKYTERTRKRFTALSGALGSDKIIRYVILSAALFFIARLSGYSIMYTICAAVSAALAAASVVCTAVKRVKMSVKK